MPGWHVCACGRSIRAPCEAQKVVVWSQMGDGEGDLGLVLDVAAEAAAKSGADKVGLIGEGGGGRVDGGTG